MNTQKMLELADFMETVPADKFDMNYFGYGVDATRPVCQTDLNVCGTTCCIAGYVLVNKGLCVSRGGLVYTDPAKLNSLGTAEDLAAEELELNERQASDLFYDWNWPTKFRRYRYDDDPDSGGAETPEDAAARIRHMVETGK